MSVANGGASASLRAQLATSTVTASGNEITDVTRSKDKNTGGQGDGRAAPDSSYGIWEATTNLVTNGGFESNTTGWTAGVDGSHARVTSYAKFGSASNKYTFDGTGQTGAHYDITLSASTQYALSVWVYVDQAYSGSTELFLTTADFTDITTNDSSGSTITISGNKGRWIRVTRIVTTGTDTAGAIRINANSGTPANGAIYYLDGVQAEAQPVVTPYVETDGGTASRSDSRIQASASAIDETQGWVAMRMRTGWGNTGEPSGGAGWPQLFRWYDDSTHRIEAYYGESANRLYFDRQSVGLSQVSRALTVNIGDLKTIIFAWTSGSVKISVDGSVFDVTNQGNVPVLAATSVDLFSNAAANNYFDSDILWTATGTGTLSDADAAAINRYGNSDPNIPDLLTNATSSAPTFVWKADNSNYQDTNPSYRAALQLDDTYLYRSGAGALTLQNATNSLTALNIQNAAGTSVLNVDTTNGRVGIGTSSPLAPLDIRGDARINSYITFNVNGDWLRNAGGGVILNSGNGTDTTLSAPGATNLLFKTNGTQRAQFDSSGNISLGNAVAPANGLVTIGTNTTAATGGIYFGTDTNLYRVGPDTLKTDDQFQAGGKIVANTVGNIAQIGAVGPSSQLGATFQDTNLYRSAADTLRTDDNFGVGSTTGLGNTGGLLFNTGGLVTATRAGSQAILQGAITGDTNARFEALTTGQLSWGPGNAAADTTLYRSAANTLKTDDTFVGGADIQVTTLGSADTATYLCRNAATQLATCNTTGTGAAFLQGGNSFGTTATLGTNDANNLAFETGGTTRWIIDTNGHLTPNVDDTYDIGSDTKRVRDLYTGPGTIHVGTSTSDEGTLTYNTTTNNLAFGATNGILFQNSANSTTAFQIQNSGSTSILTGDTTNQLITSKDLQISTGNLTLANNGASASLRAQLATSTVTASGNEITDVTRSKDKNTGGQGDGWAAPDSSYGIWEGTTNYHTNGGLETNTTSWASSGAGSTIARDISIAKFGSASLKVITPGSGLYEGAGAYYFGFGTVANSQTWTYSVWVKAPAGATLYTSLVEVDSSYVITGQTDVNFIGTGNWQRITATRTLSASSPVRLMTYVRTITSVQAIPFYVDGAQLEQKGIATPYVETDGGTASRSASRVQAPVSVLNPTQGWVAVRVRIPWSSTASPQGNDNPIFGFGKGNNTDRLIIYWRGTAGPWWDIRRSIVGSAFPQISVSDSWTGPTTKTLIMSWTSTTIAFSKDGGTFTSQANTDIPSSLTSIDFGRATDIDAQGDIDVLWAATGTGTLSDADAAAINRYGNSDPNVADIATAATSSTPTFVWKADNANYQDTNPSYRAALQLDDTYLYRSGAGALTLQNATNSTTGFAIQNAAGTNLLVVNTTASQLAVGP